jgi:hypothetical protein
MNRPSRYKGEPTTVFKITDYIEFDPKGRAICPFCFSEGKTGKNLSLIPNTDGAYKCHRGCSPEDIRSALGQPKDQQVPAALAKPPTPAPNVLVHRSKITEGHQQLLKSKEPMQWLLERKFTREQIEHYQLGLGRSKCGNTHLPSISIPIEGGPGRATFYQKKRVAPWLPESEQPAGYKKWSQYGIPAVVWFTHQPVDPEQTWIVAGEWDAMALGWAMRDQSAIAVCTFTAGEGNLPRDKAEMEKLKGQLVTFYDLDDAGTKGAAKVQAAFPDRCKVATVPAPQNAPVGWDVSDSLNAGYTLSDFTEAAQVAKAFTAPRKPNPLRDKLVTNRDLIDRAPDYVDFLVPDLLTEDELFVLAGPPRGGKSLLCMNLAKAIAEGGKFLDRPVTQGSVLYVNCEDSEAKVKERQVSQGWDADAPVFWLNRFKLSELDNLIEVAKDIDDLRLIILDTLSRVRDDNCNESSADLSRVLEPLQEFAQEQKVCIIITHHTSKMTAEDLTDPFASIRGSGAIRATCRGAIVLAPGDNFYRLVAENGHSENLDVKIRLDPNNLEWKLLGKWNPKAVNESVRDRILDFLNDHFEATIDHLAKELIIGSNVVKTTLWRLMADNMVTKRGGVKGNPALYTRGNISLSVAESVPKCNEDSVSVLGYPVTKNILFTLEEKVIIEDESDHSNNHFSSERSLLKEVPKEENSYHIAPNPDAVKKKKGNRFRNKRAIVPKQTVKIKHGQFYGREAQVVQIHPDGMVEVRGESWAVSHKYAPEHLQIVREESIDHPPIGGDQ